MEEVQLNPAQRNVLPYLVAFAGAAIGILGLLTPWLSIGARGISGSSSDQGKLTYLVVGSLIVLGLSTFVEQLRRYTKIISLVTMAICFDVLVSYAIWANRAFSAVEDFNNASENLDDFGGLFGDALSNLANSIEPSVTTGFYMVCAAAVIGLVASILIFAKPSKANASDETKSDQSAVEGESIENGMRSHFGVSRIQFIVTVAGAILGLVFVIVGSGSNELSSSLNSNSLNPLSANNNETEEVSSDVFDCLQVTNTKNVIKLNQSRFSGDPSPTDIFVATQFRIINNCGKEVSGLKASMIFQNVVGDEVFTGEFTEDQTIKVGESITTTLNSGWTFNEFEEEHGVLAGMDASKTKAILMLSKVAFEDGTTISE